MAEVTPDAMSRRIGFRWNGAIARYLLALTAARFFAITFGLTGILLLERLLRLLDFVVAYNASPMTLGAMLLALTPHYLSLAIPAGALISLMITILALRDNGELHAIASWGVSTWEMTWLFTCVTACLSLVLLLLTGFLNPHARYAFRKEAHEAKFISAAEIIATRPTFWRADKYDIYIPAWSEDEPVMLRPILIRKSGAVSDVIEATTGRVVEQANSQTVTIQLKDGRGLRHSAVKGAPAVVRFNTLSIPIIHEEGGAFRPRGADERELTLTEILAETKQNETDDPRYAVDFHMRFIRALSIIIFPLLAFSACVGPPKRTRFYGPALAVTGILSYHFLLYGLESLAVQARGLALPVLWAPFLLMAVILIAAFIRKTGRFRATHTGAAS